MLPREWRETSGDHGDVALEQSHHQIARGRREPAGLPAHLGEAGHRRGPVGRLGAAGIEVLAQHPAERGSLGLGHQSIDQVVRKDCLTVRVRRTDLAIRQASRREERDHARQVMVPANGRDGRQGLRERRPSGGHEQEAAGE